MNRHLFILLCSFSVQTLAMEAAMLGRIQKISESQITQFLIAVKENDYIKVKWLLEHGVFAGTCDGDGYSALKYAEQSGYTQIVELLKNPPTSLQARDAEPASPTFIFEPFQMERCEFNSKDMPIPISAWDQFQSKLKERDQRIVKDFFECITRSDIRAIKLYLKAGVSPLVRNDIISALEYAQTLGQKEIVELLQGYLN